MIRKRILVGIFVLGGIALFAVGLFIIGSQEQLFAHHYKIYADFSRINTLQSGAKVRVSGMDAGEVTGIHIPNTASAPFRLELQVDRKFRHLIRGDSVATLETQGMVGAVYVNISRGTGNSPEMHAGGTVRSREPVDISDLIRQAGTIMNTSQATIEDLRHHADRAIGNIGNAAGHADSLIVSIHRDVKKITSNAGDIMASVRQGHGVAGKLLMDRTAGANVSATLGNARQASANVDRTTQKVNALVTQIQQRELLEDVQKTLENAQHMTGQLNRAITAFLASQGKSQPTAVELKQTVAAAQQAMSNLADDTEALKTNFFLRGFFKRRGFFDLSDLTPSEYLASSFLKRPHLRACVSTTSLFNSPSGESYRFSNNDRRHLNQAMWSLVPQLPNNPIMVEGYSAGSNPDQAYLTSRQRALAVREYLESHFHLSPELVGVMPLGERPRLGVGRSSWSGVCVVLAISKR